MKRMLIPHPDTPCAALTGIEVEIAQPKPQNLSLRYCLTGAIGDVLLPPPAPSARADELWLHTCFEAFLRAGESYYEFNISPSTQWAVYRFDSYRAGVRNVDLAATPRIKTRFGEESYDLGVSLDLSGLDLPPGASWRFGLSAVIEETGGAISYWALAHPPGKPDFHHADASTLQFT
jgi:hypothetical protein